MAAVKQRWLTLAMLAASGQAYGQTTIRTYQNPTTSGIGVSVNQVLGPGYNFPPGIYAYSEGQTFNAPLRSNIITDFSFWLTGRGGLLMDPGLKFRAYLAPWSGLFGSVNPIFTSAVFTGPPSGVSVPQQYTFATNGLSLTPGSAYVAFLSALEAGNDPAEHFAFANIDGSNPFAGGQHVSAAAIVGTPISSMVFNIDGAAFDLMFEANFGRQGTASPEPSGALLLATGLIAVGVSRRRRHTAQS